MNKILSDAEALISNAIIQLKIDAGSHSPSLLTISEALPDLKIHVDACFLSNPYATDLFIRYLKKELIHTNKIRDILEFYPSQNKVIAKILAQYFNLPASNFFIGNGAIEIIQAVLHNFTKNKLLIVIPTFSSYYEFVKKGVNIVYYPLLKESDFKLDALNYLNAVKREKPDTIVLINPNNPNGGFIALEQIVYLLDNLQEVETIIIDESFIHFAFENSDYELLSSSNLIEKYNNLIVLKSMSKDFGIAGIRAGYAIMNSNRVDQLLSNGYLWNSNGLSEYFFRLYVRTDFIGEYEIVRKKYIIESQIFFKELRKIDGIIVHQSKANFVLIELLGNINSDEFVINLLIKYGVYTRTCSDKLGLDGHYIRLASRSKKENDILINSIRSLLKSYEETSII